MPTLDWPLLLRSALWIVGLSIVLAALSYTWWWNSIAGRRGLSTPRFLAPASLGFALFCSGLALSSQRWWERALWGLLCALFVVQLALYIRHGWRHGWDAQLTDEDSEGEGL